MLKRLTLNSVTKGLNFIGHGLLIAAVIAVLIWGYMEISSRVSDQPVKTGISSTYSD